MSLLTCKKFYEELNLLLDDEAACELKAALTVHMEECPHCYVVFDTTRQTISIVKNVCGGPEPKALPEELKNRLMSVLSKKMAEGKPGCS
jgi:mycothiol system anti-sigma-R factor